MHPSSCALPFQYVPAHVTRGALVANGHSFAPASCRNSQYLRTFVRLSASLWNGFIVTLYLMAWDWRVLRAEPTLSCWHNLLFIFVYYCFLFFLPYMGWLCLVGSSDSWSALTPDLALLNVLIIIIIIIH